MTKSFPVRFATPALLALVLGGCATSQQEHSHGDTAAGPGGGMHGMCEMHGKGLAGRSDADRKAMMEERKQMQEMMANCR